MGFHTINIEKIRGKSEDAEPIAKAIGSGLGAVAVFDGMGGAGANRVITQDGGGQTQAWVASRLAQATVVDALRQIGPHLQPTAAFAEQLTDQLCDRLAEKVTELNIGASKIRSKLIRTLPTTLALALCRVDDNMFQVQAIWAGDSRVYLLTRAGLQQLSNDDLRSGGDALTNLQDDSPLSNMVHASGPFHLNIRNVTRQPPEPAILFAATDGCFGFVPTPWHFEFMLVDSLCDSRSAERWIEELTSRIGKITGDDSTMGIAIIGSQDFADLKKSFKNRRSWLQDAVKRYDEGRRPLDDDEKRLESEQKRFREASERYAEAEQRSRRAEEQHQEFEKTFKDKVNETWTEYRDRYERHIRSTMKFTTAVHSVSESPDAHETEASPGPVSERPAGPLAEVTGPAADPRFPAVEATARGPEGSAEATS